MFLNSKHKLFRFNPYHDEIETKIDLKLLENEFLKKNLYTTSMCSNYSVHFTKEIFESQGVEIRDTFDKVDTRFFPGSLAPVILKNDAGLKLDQFVFSLIPAWSAESKIKFATHNARIETVLEKASWKKPFLSQHCLVPISGFYESVYDGDFAGNVIRFEKPDKSLLFAAGVYDIWKNSSGSEVIKSFSILTTEPTEFILKNGHDRSPLFLDFANGDEWVHIQSDGKSMRKFLLEKNQKPELSIVIDRPLKPGWQKRK